MKLLNGFSFLRLLSRSQCICMMLLGLPFFAQGQFIVDPVQLNLSTESGSELVSLTFAGNPVVWHAESDVDWLSLKPDEGNTQADIQIDFETNEGLRRAAVITFVAESGSLDTLRIEVHQLQGILADRFQFSWDIVHRPWEAEPMFPFVAQISTTYEPFEVPAFLNVMATSSRTSDSVWIVQNVYLPDRSFTDTLQKLSINFDMGTLGFEPGEDPVGLGITYCLSYLPDSTMPKIPSDKWHEKFYRRIVQTPTTLLEQDSILSNPFILSLIRLSLPAQVKDLVYIGCSMPVGDLDEEKHKGDKYGCGPAAAANSLKWLENYSDSVKGLPVWRDLYEQLRTLMGLATSPLTLPKTFIQGKLDLVEAYDLPIKVKYQTTDRRAAKVHSTTGNTTAENRGSIPKKEFVIKELKDEEDVEVLYSRGPRKVGHIMTLTGTVTINNNTFVYLKGDIAQETVGGADQKYSPLIEKDGLLRIPYEGGIIHTVVSESPDTKHLVEASSIEFDRYCKIIKRALPPGGSISFKFPNVSKRTLGMTIRVWNKAESPGYRTKARWIVNSGKTRTFKNNSKDVIFLFIHNDDYHFDKKDGVRVYKPFTVEVTKKLNDPSGTTSPSNDVGLDGFSIGANDNSYSEFGSMTDSELTFVDTLNSDLTDFPAQLQPSGTTKVTIEKSVNNWNRFWLSMELVLGIDSVVAPGYLRISSLASGFSDSLWISGQGDTALQIGGIKSPGVFDLTLQTDGALNMFFDNVGIPSNIQLNQLLRVIPDSLSINNNNAGDTTFYIRNDGKEPLNWYIGETASWYSVSPESGLNEEQIMLSYTANEGAERKDTLHIYSTGTDNSPQSIHIRQKGALSNVDAIDIENPVIKLFPNPTDGFVRIHLAGVSPGKLLFRVIDLSGRIIRNFEYPTPGGDLVETIDLSTEADGEYYIIIINNKQQYRTKLNLIK